MTEAAPNKLSAATASAAGIPLKPASNGQALTFSDPCNDLIAALVKAQAKITNPPRSREVVVHTRTGPGYSFKYAPLDTIIEHVRKPLTDNGLWFIQPLQQENGKYQLCTLLFHTSGQYVRSEHPLLTEGGGNQAFGSALTYMRRYSLEAILGLAAQDDDDSHQSVDDKEVDKITDRKATPAPVSPRAGGQHEVGAFILYDAFGTETETFENPEKYLTALANNVKDNAAWFENNADQVTYIENFHGGQVAHNANGSERSDGYTIAKMCQQVRKLAAPPQTPLEAG